MKQLIKLTLLISFNVIYTFSFSQTIISGTISENLNDSKEPIPFANVKIKELNKGTTTNFDGNYSFNNIPDGDYTIISSFVGYAKDSVVVSIINGQSKKLILFYYHILK